MDSQIQSNSRLATENQSRTISGPSQALTKPSNLTSHNKSKPNTSSDYLLNSVHSREILDELTVDKMLKPNPNRFYRSSALPEPTRFLIRQPIEKPGTTYDAKSSIEWTDSAGNRISLEKIAENVANHLSPIEAVASLLSRNSTNESGAPIIDYQAYGNLANARPTVRAAWSRGHAECDGIMSIGAYILSQSGTVPAEHVFVIQSFAYGGWHNVIVFRDPLDQNWKVINYDKITVLKSAKSLAEATRQFFHGNHGTTIAYQVNDPDSPPKAVYHIKSDHVAITEGATSQPGIRGAMRPSYGTPRGFNDTPSARSELGQIGSRSGARMGLNGFHLYSATGKNSRLDLEANINPTSHDLDRIGFSWLTTNDHKIAGVKSVFHRHAGEESGLSGLLAGEYWNNSSKGYLGLVAGLDFRVATKAGASGDPLNSLGPLLSLSGGQTHSILNVANFRLDGFWNATGRLSIPIVLGNEERATVKRNSNGVSPGGIIEPGGLVSNSFVGGNTGIRMELGLGNNLTLSTSLIGHAVLTDPTLAPLGKLIPMRGSVDSSTSFRYASPQMTNEIGFSATHGALYHRDSRWHAWSTNRIRAGNEVSVETALSIGEYIDAESFASAKVALNYQPNESLSLRLSSGANASIAENGSTRVLPEFGFDLSYDF